MVHDSDFWSLWEKSEAMTDEEREKLAKTYHCIYLNRESVRCARYENVDFNPKAKLLCF